MKTIFKKIYIMLMVGLLGCTFSCYADECCKAICPERPKFNNLPYLEDWSCIACCDSCRSNDWSDHIKYIGLSDDGNIWVSFGGQVRFRSESWNNFGFVDSNDATFVLSRLLLHGSLHLGKCVRIFAEGKSSLCTNRDLPGGRRTLDVDTIALQNGFVELSLPTSNCNYSVTLRAGRQELSFGKQRLVSPLDWSNTRRTFDGIALIGTWCDWTATGFYTHYVPVQKYDFNSSSTEKFYGLYATAKLSMIDTLDLYYLGRDRSRAVYDSVTGSETRHTVGLHACSQIGDTSLDYDIEAAYQWGDVGSQSISAYMLATEVGYSLLCWCGEPRIHIGFDYASGDNNSSDNKINTFSQLYPLGHKYLGWIDVVGRQNITALNFGVTLKPCDKLKVFLNTHLFWRASDTDALYNAGSGIVRSGSLSSKSQIGWEEDLLVKYTPSRHWIFLAGYSHFFVGDFINTATPAANSDIDFGYLGAQYTF